MLTDRKVPPSVRQGRKASSLHLSVGVLSLVAAAHAVKSIRNSSVRINHEHDFSPSKPCLPKYFRKSRPPSGPLFNTMPSVRCTCHNKFDDQALRPYQAPDPSVR